MSEFIIYVIATGLIRYIGTCVTNELSAQRLEIGEAIMEGSANLYTDYIVANIITSRPANPSIIDTTTLTADGVDTCVISNMPNPSTISFTVPDKVDPINTYVDTDTTLTFSTAEAGVYEITVISFPYLPLTFIITAV